jgi:hypothetical protein
MESAHQDYLRGAWDTAVQLSQAEYVEARDEMVGDMHRRGMQSSGQRWTRDAELHAKYTGQAIRACFEQLDIFAATLNASQAEAFWSGVGAGLPDVVSGHVRSHVGALLNYARAKGAATGGLELAASALLAQQTSNLRKLVADAVQMRMVLNQSRAQTDAPRALSPGSAPDSVFISSTFLDNRVRREVVEDAVLRAGMRPVGMERFTASPYPAVSECLRSVEECDIYLGILAHRYGWIPDGQDKSITELEYDAAKAAGRRCLVFILDESVPVKLDEVVDGGDDRWEKQKKLDAFKRKCANDQMAAHFVEANLGVLVLQALQSVITSMPRTQPPTGTSTSGERMSTRATALMLRLTQDFVRGGFPNHRTWNFSPETEETLPVLNELRALALIAPMGMGNERWRLTDAGKTWVMRHRHTS